MNEIARIPPGQAARVLSKQQWDTLLRTIGADCSPSEFELYGQVVKSTGLDPFRKQIVPIIFGKSDAAKRRMSIVVSQDGLRTLAARCGDYRPASDPPVITYTRAHRAREAALDEAYAIKDREQRAAAIKQVEEDWPTDPTNPAGIEKVSVALWKQDRVSGEWHPVYGEALWSEYAPIRMEAEEYEWVETGEVWPDSNKPKKKKVPKQGAGRHAKLDDSGQWAKMPVLMITKCATMQALRAGWPDTFGGLHGEEEVAKAQADDRNVIELAEEAAAERRAQAIGAKGDEFAFIGDDGVLVFVPAGSFADRVVEYIGRYSTRMEVESFKVRNREGLRRFWAKRKGDAVEMNAAIEKIVDNLPATTAAAE